MQIALNLSLPGIRALDPLAPYAANGIFPNTLLDFSRKFYGANGATSNQSVVLEGDRSGLATTIDRDGLLKWGPHNLALNSATPATQSITVVSGADYTVECTGSGSMVLSGAGTGTVSEGSPVEVTASTTTLTLTVSGSVDLMWCYRSDLGGMQKNPATNNTYVPTTAAARYLPRTKDYVDSVPYLLSEPAATNLLHDTETLATQTEVVTAQPYTLSFWGTGTVSLSGASTDGPLVGTSADDRVTLTFTPSAATLTLTVSGAVTRAQLEEGSVATSYIPNVAASGSVTRTADALVIPHEAFDWPTGGSPAVSIGIDGLMTYADRNVSEELRFFNQEENSSNFLRAALRTSTTRTGQVVFTSREDAVSSVVDSAPSSYSPGVNVPFNIASRHGSTFINGAVDGTTLTEDTTPTALPDLSTTDIDLAPTGVVRIKSVRLWNKDVGNAGIAEASS